MVQWSTLSFASFCVGMSHPMSAAAANRGKHQWRGMIVACRDMPITFFLQTLRALATLKKLNAETQYIALNFEKVR